MEFEPRGDEVWLSPATATGSRGGHRHLRHRSELPADAPSASSSPPRPARIGIARSWIRPSAGHRGRPQLADTDPLDSACSTTSSAAFRWSPNLGGHRRAARLWRRRRARPARPACDDEGKISRVGPVFAPQPHRRQHPRRDGRAGGRPAPGGGHRRAPSPASITTTGASTATTCGSSPTPPTRPPSPACSPTWAPPPAARRSPCRWSRSSTSTWASTSPAAAAPATPSAPAAAPNCR